MLATLSEPPERADQRTGHWAIGCAVAHRNHRRAREASIDFRQVSLVSRNDQLSDGANDQRPATQLRGPVRWRLCVPHINNRPLSCLQPQGKPAAPPPPPPPPCFLFL